MDYKKLFSSANWVSGQLVAALDLIRTGRSAERNVYSLISMLTGRTTANGPEALTCRSRTGLAVTSVGGSATDFSVSPGVSFIRDPSKEGAGNGDPLLPGSYVPSVIVDPIEFQVSAPPSYPRIDEVYVTGTTALDTNENRAVKTQAVNLTPVDLRRAVTGGVEVVEGDAGLWSPDGGDAPAYDQAALVAYIVHDSPGVVRIFRAGHPMEIGPEVQGTPPSYMAADHLVEGLDLTNMGNLKARFAPGFAVIGGRTLSVPPKEVTFSAANAPGGDTRIDRVVVNSEGILEVVEGVNNDPSPVPDGALLVWGATIAAGATTFSASDLRQQGRWLTGNPFREDASPAVRTFSFNESSGGLASLFSLGEWSHNGVSRYAPGSDVTFEGAIDVSGVWTASTNLNTTGSIGVDGGNLVVGGGGDFTFQAGGTFLVQTVANLAAVNTSGYTQESGSFTYTSNAEGDLFLVDTFGAATLNGVVIQTGGLVAANTATLGTLVVTESATFTGTTDLQGLVQLPDTVTFENARTKYVYVQLASIAEAWVGIAGRVEFDGGPAGPIVASTVSSVGEQTYSQMQTLDLPAGALIKDLDVIVDLDTDGSGIIGNTEFNIALRHQALADTTTTFVTSLTSTTAGRVLLRAADIDHTVVAGNQYFVNMTCTLAGTHSVKIGAVRITYTVDSL